MEPLCDKVKDWEYGVEWNSALIMCPGCGLVSHNPPITAAQILSLYPDNYLAHSGAASSRSIYGRLKEILARRTARNIAASVPIGGRLMEIGCGKGHLLKTIASVRPDIHMLGVDIEQVEISGLPDFTFYHGQFEEVEIEPNSVDLIYCSNLIEHVPDPGVFAKKVKQSLKAGGQVLGVTPDHLSIDRYLFGRYWAGYHYPRHTFVFNHRNIVTLLREADFEGINVKGSYSFWYLSLANSFMELPGTKKRGLLFALITAAFLPLDFFINLLRCHGSMTFKARSSYRI
jgi:SAM-dependent methyltransferase